MVRQFCLSAAVAWCGVLVHAQTTQPAETAASRSDQVVADTAPGSQPEAAAKDKSAQPPFFRLDYSGDFWHRPALTGDWGGARSKLANNGISFNVETLQYVQGNAHGGKSTNSAFRYGGHSDFFLQLDTYRMGLWPGGYFKVSGETQWGQGVGRQTGSILPPNFATILLEKSDDPGATALDEYYMMQFLSPKIGLLAGMVDLTQLPGNNEFFSNRYNQFMNTAFWFNPVAFSTVPLAAMTAGLIYSPTDWLSGATLVVDDHGVPTYSGFKSGFHTHGVSILQSATVKVKPFGQVGHQRFHFSLTTKDHIALEDTGRLALSGVLAPRYSRLNLPRTILVGRRPLRLPSKLLRAGLSRILRPEPEGGDWGFWYDFDQYLYTCPHDKDQGFGLFGSFGWGNPKFNPINTFYSLGLGGKGVIPERPKDRYGVGYFCMSISDQFPAILNAQNEQGVELFYNIEITPWLHITPDLQVLIQPGGTPRNDVAIVYGLRTQVSF